MCCSRTDTRVRRMQDDAAEAEWFPVTRLPQPLAFDHKEVVRTSLAKLLEQQQAKETGARSWLRCSLLSTFKVVLAC